MRIVRAGLKKWDNLKRDLPGDPMLGFEDKSAVTDTQTRDVEFMESLKHVSANELGCDADWAEIGKRLAIAHLEDRYVLRGKGDKKTHTPMRLTLRNRARYAMELKSAMLLQDENLSKIGNEELAQIITDLCEDGRILVAEDIYPDPEDSPDCYKMYIDPFKRIISPTHGRIPSKLARHFSEGRKYL